MLDLPTGTVTLLFTDIEGSTRLLEQLGNRYADMLAEHRQLLRTAFQRWHGREVDTQGDSFFASFARAIDAVSAAADAQRMLATHEWPENVAVRVRMGLHTGEPQLAAEGYVGLDVHRGARLMSAAHGGQVLLSHTTRDLVEHDLPPGLSLRDLGEYRLKDIGRPRPIFQLVIDGLPADFPPLRIAGAQSRPPNNLPAHPTPFIGRTQEVTTVCSLLRRAEVRLLTLTGTAGVGKTRLSLQAAEQLNDLFRDGIFLVALAPVNDAALVVPAIAETVGVSEAGDQSLLERLETYLYDKQLLLVLDNFEQVTDAAPIVAELLAGCPHLKIMVTSREILHIRAEHEFNVPPLAVPDPRHLPDLQTLSQYAAVALFIERAQAAKPDFQITTTNAAAIANVCTRLDGLPLAIELAAARSKYFSPQALLTRLERGLTVLTGGPRDLPARHQTLREAIAWSYELLEAEEQKLFRRLAVFVDGWTLDASMQVGIAAGELERDILELQETLGDKSLLRRQEQAEDEIRFWMLQTLREYGLECLANAGETEATRDAHAAYYLALAEEAHAHLSGAEQAHWFDRLEQELENLRAALEWLLEQAETKREQAERALRLCCALVKFWETRGHPSEGQAFIERALAFRQDVAVLVQARALRGAGVLALIQDDYERAETLTRESLRLFQKDDNKPGIAETLRLLGLLACSRNNYASARSLLLEALEAYQGLNDKRGVAYTLEILAQVATSEGEYTRAHSLLEESLSIHHSLHEQFHAAHLFYLLARVLFYSKGDQEKAHALAQEGLETSRRMGHHTIIGYNLKLLGQIHLMQGEGEKARELASESVAILKDLGDRYGLADALTCLARVAAYQGNMVEAQSYYREGWEIAQDIGSKELSAACLEGLGEIAAGQGKPWWAARLWGAAAMLRATLGAPMPPVYRTSYEKAVAATRTQMGEADFKAAWAEGRTAPAEQALAA